MTWFENGQPADTFIGEWKDGRILTGMLTDVNGQEYNIDNRDD